MAHDHRMNPVGGPYLNGKVGPNPGDKDFPDGEAYQHAMKYMRFSALPGPDQMKKTRGSFSSIGLAGMAKYITDLRNITQEIGLDPDNTEHLGSVHRIYSVHLSAQDRHYLTGNAGLPNTNQSSPLPQTGSTPGVIMRPEEMHDFSKRRAPQKFED